ncbi:MAG TPA: hypothetical protein VF221_08065 [Chloroflexota bacterium]
MSDWPEVGVERRETMNTGDDMEDTRNVDDLEEALRHARAGVKALEAARAAAGSSRQIYPTHIYLAAVELAHAIEVSMKVALRTS